LSEEDFVKAAEIKDIPASKMKEVQVDGENICVANVEGKYYAIGSICTHEGGPLADGTLEGYEVECPWHQSKFDVRTGEVTSPPASEPEPAYEVKVDGNNILIKKQSKSKSSSPQIELTLLEKDKFEGTDVTSFKFSKQNNDHDNQVLEDKTPFKYTAGQFAFFDIGGVYNDPKGPIRHFTISSSPTENFIMFSTRIRDSPYKQRLLTLEKGSKVKVRGPEGQFVLHEDYSKPAVFLSGGIGVTPFRSMLKYATDKQLPIKIIMFDSNRNRSNILFRREFDDWVNRNKNLKIIYTISEEGDQEHGQQSSSAAKNDWKGEYGRIDKAMILKYVDNNILDSSIFYICGPPSMLKAMQSLLQEELEIPNERIKVEEFTGY
jgi:ferredoxin-NADP reductase/nitrite reductase/ring-hydroxylating ferredoxin subunit